MTAHDPEQRRPIIVAGYDGSPAARAAVAHALDLAGTSGSVHLVHSYLVPDDFVGASYYEFARQDAQSAAETVVAGLERDEPRLTECHVLLGAPATQLCRVAHEYDADAIVVGTRGVGRIRGALLGSVAHDLLHQADRPVTVIPERMVRRAGDAAAQVAAS